MSHITRSRGAERTGIEALIFAQLVPDRSPTLFFQPHRRIRRLRSGFVAAPEQMAENDEGRVCVRVAETLPFERFRDAYTQLERGGLRGKIVLTP